MYDPELSIRFFRGLTEAMIHSAEASVEATKAWQTAIATGKYPTVSSPQTEYLAASSTAMDAMSAWMWPVSFMMPGAVQPTVPNFFRATEYAAVSRASMGVSAWTNMSNWPASMAMPGLQPWKMPTDMSTLAQTSKAFWTWPSIPWHYYQMPFTAAMLSAGIPNAIAGPSVRATLSALDAADAARLQLVSMSDAVKRSGADALDAKA